MQRIKIRYILLATLLVLILILKPAFLVRTKTYLFEAFSLPFRIANSIKTSFRPKKSYIRENAFLKEKSALLALELSRADEIVRENERLREIMDFKNLLPYKSIFAKVIGKVPSTWTSAILINKGARDGMKRPMAVCTVKGLIGSIAETGPFTSKVMLLTDPNSRIGVVLENSRETGVLVGTQEGRCKVIYLGMESDIKKGEKVFTSGFGGLFPEQIIVGEVEEIGTDNIGFYRYAVIRPSQNLNAVEEVLCIE